MAHAAAISANALLALPPVPGLIDNVIGECYRACGRLVQGVECVFFLDDAGTLLQLEDNGDFSVGDRVEVQGILNLACGSFCLQGDGCVESNSIVGRPGADIDCDGVVGFGDLLTVLSAWDPCPLRAACPADLDGSTQVDFADLLIVLTEWD